MTEIRNEKKILITPVSEADIASLKVGDVIYLDGEMVTGRDSVHGRVVEEGIPLPVDIQGKVIMHAGPIVKKCITADEKDDGKNGNGGNDCNSSNATCSSPYGSSTPRYEMVSIGPTTSMRMERFQYEFLRETGARIIIGKGGMKEKTAAGCKEFGAVHCVMPAGNAVVGASCVEEITGVHWLDLGAPEAVWECRVKEFGPLIVMIDATGRNYFEEKKLEYNKKKDEQIEAISKQVHFIK